MSIYGSDVDPGRNSQEAKAFEARAAFKGLLQAMGVEIVEDAIRASRENQEQGLKGITIPSEDHSLMLTINEAGVSFSIDEWRDYKVPTDTAIAAIAEMRTELEQNG